MTELAAHYNVSRKTAHKWLARFAQGGVAALKERSRAPHEHPNATAQAVVAAVLHSKAVHPKWGPAKLQPGPQEPPEVVTAWPSPSTRGAILARHGLTTQRRRRVQLWSQPFRRCDPLTISDAFSRLLLCCDVLPKPNYAHVRRAFERTFREYGLPEAIRTDNGPPFASVGAGGLSPLAAWWVKLGILPERIKPGHPEQNGPPKAGCTAR